MTIEIFTQFTAEGDQLIQQYRLRKRFCVDHLCWPDRNVMQGLEYDQYDHPFTLYVMWRDDDDVARGLLRFTPCNLPFMIKDVWPQLVQNCPMPNRPDQWELTRLCVEKCVESRISEVIYELMRGSEILAERMNISEYWYMAPKGRIEGLWPHNHTYVGPGLDVGYEYCFAAYSDASKMVQPNKREALHDEVFDLRYAA